MKMKKRLMIKTTVATALLMMLAFSALSTNALFAKAKDEGIGKFLTVEIVGEGSVTATKVQSGETWYFPSSITEKVGAGTVSLEAFASEGWEFSHWEGDLTGSENPTDYKTEKYGEVAAVFVKNTFTITAIVAPIYIYPEPRNGYIETSVEGNIITIDVEEDVIVGAGDSQTFDFYPDSGYHVSTIMIADELESKSVAPADSYLFENVQKDWTMVVFFSLDGEAYVPEVEDGTDMQLDLGGMVRLHFYSTTGGGIVTQQEIILEGELRWTSLLLWAVSIGVSFEDIVEIALPYSGVAPQHVFWGESLDELYSDVNADGVVDNTDHVEVARAISTAGRDYDATYDVNRDGYLNEEDIHTVDANLETTLLELDFYYEAVGSTLYIYTPTNLFYRVR